MDCSKKEIRLKWLKRLLIGGVELRGLLTYHLVLYRAGPATEPDIMRKPDSSAHTSLDRIPKPTWMRVRPPSGPEYEKIKNIVHSQNLHTLCEAAFCPNLSECWRHESAAFLLLGDVCTRGCTFCIVKTGRPEPPDPQEPDRIADAVEALGLNYTVLASVNRDDLDDGGAMHFAQTVNAIKRRKPNCRIEAMIPDFRGNHDALQVILDTDISVLNHNLETTPRLFKEIRPGARYDRSLELLSHAHKLRPNITIKSGFLLGFGEETDEIYQAMNDLRRVGCHVLTLGQYMPPSTDHHAVDRYVHPDEFKRLEKTAYELGFRHVESGPLVRSTYRAWVHAAPGS